MQQVGNGIARTHECDVGSVVVVSDVEVKAAPARMKAALRRPRSVFFCSLTSKSISQRH